MQTKSESKTWSKVPNTPGQLRHKGGRYFGRFTLGGKTYFKALKTDGLAIAKTRFAEENAKVERVGKAARSTRAGTATKAAPGST
ncbi:MAG: hypothetical protein SFV32_09390 [Opitutaceae bacterium]|nr:hypothetical protein [Opitutaceae bacterium]